MRFGDRLLQQWRIRVAESWIPDGSRVLDIGCYQGEFFQHMGNRIVDSIGIDPLAPEIKTDNYVLLKSTFSPPTKFIPDSFDAIVILATMEHMLDTESIAMECARILRPAGRVIVTVPSPLVDQIIDILVVSEFWTGCPWKNTMASSLLNYLTFFVRHPCPCSPGTNFSWD